MRAFTIVELLVVMSIILVLAGLVLATSSYVHNKGARSRAEAEIAAMSSALENYKADNGAYPNDSETDSLDPTQGDPTQYQNANLWLYEKLSGDTNADRQPDNNAISYLAFKTNQLSPNDQTPVKFIKDPFGNSYGYSTIYSADVANNKTPPRGYNPTFDLWSTAGATTDSGKPGCIKNW